jgi:HEAT repeat protein
MLELFLAAINGRDDVVAEQAAQELSFLPVEQHPEAIKVLRELLLDPESEKRWWAVRGLSAIPSHQVPPILTEMLTELSAEIRQSAALGLGMKPVSTAVPGLIRNLEDRDQLAVQLAA